MSALPPGSTIGILGGGQLGRMSILAGRRMGYRFVVYEPGAGGPASMVADEEVNAGYDDLDALRAFAAKVDVVTFEFENVEAQAAEVLTRAKPVRPSPEVLFTCQDREREKTFFRKHGFPCAPFAVVRSADELRQACREIGLPGVVKSARFGYDGKGQVKITDDAEIENAWQQLGTEVAVFEKWISFSGEFSVICARSANGETGTLPVAENVHRNHILHTSIVPARISAELEASARSLAMEVARALDVVGLLAVELFLTDEGWLINELAPRPHNSGHYSFDACLTSQFEQHIRCVCGLPLGDPALLKPVAMVNLLGDLWNSGEPDWIEVLSHPTAKLHLYGKAQARPGRKMGHFCVMSNDVETALEQALAIESQLQSRARA